LTAVSEMLAKPFIANSAGVIHCASKLPPRQSEPLMQIESAVIDRLPPCVSPKPWKWPSTCGAPAEIEVDPVFSDSVPPLPPVI
jgi:hypothetical protein